MNRLCFMWTLFCLFLASATQLSYLKPGNHPQPVGFSKSLLSYLQSRSKVHHLKDVTQQARYRMRYKTMEESKYQEQMLQDLERESKQVKELEKVLVSVAGKDVSLDQLSELMFRKQRFIEYLKDLQEHDPHSFMKNAIENEIALIDQELEPLKKKLGSAWDDRFL